MKGRPSIAPSLSGSNRSHLWLLFSAACSCSCQLRRASAAYEHTPIEDIGHLVNVKMRQIL